ncbi:bifunctional aldolase/short-chain dehydrogenase [Inmirania thermothiophila]|uniref:Rhamnose utilization protein RhaD (Predicted bifunctional aldolase and dehydrogenase) n=1 Tax=Inmirania thermothiophila TaxID=1750597 RepID=A0A3N1YCA3_9GAMM|nr:bifunctional aldolase/short-chain dehydrogenase [Inmirania thermothiophila]ROR35017.1 rhamnose utilization protein RhaD (predicted bifunctional aldolase and dehydrogenase) [Inmirania thermothiophila]
MESLWDDADAARFRGPLGLRVYTSRLLGRDPALVLHGGGNTSVKVEETDLFGEPVEVLYVKGSGADLADIDETGFTPLRLAPVRRLATLPALSDTAMVEALATQKLRPSAPAPSVEAILHALIPHRYVDHTHADAVLAICHGPEGEAWIREIYQEVAVIVPYVMPGFPLARLAAERFAAEATEATEGMVLLHHGVFSFGATARESYERMIALVDRAERWLRTRRAWSLPAPAQPPAPPLDRTAVAALRRAVSEAAGRPMILTLHRDAEALAFARDPEVGRISQQGPLTPDHVIRTKPWPMIGRDVAAYTAAYRAYFERNAPRSREPLTMLDPAPRVILDPELGLASAGRSLAEADAAADLYRHTMAAIRRAEALGGYRALAEADLFDVEYWELEQAKLRRGGAAPPFAGEIALVTGAASGIGRACAALLAERGAAVAGLDRDPAVETACALGLCADVTDDAAVEAALDRMVARLGGLDLLILNAGLFPASLPIERLDDETWRRTFAVNLDANLRLMRLAAPLLRASPRGGRVVVVGSRNVPAPGPGAAAYSASKAALTQLARVAALEWGRDGVRVNVVHPDAVFDTGLWTEEVLASRAASYGMTVEAYKRRNVLGAEVSSRDVAELVCALCGPAFARTTGAQIPIDGGNERVI